MRRRLSTAGFSFAFTLGMVYLAASIDWRPARPAVAPRLLTSFQSSERLVAGAALVNLTPAFPVVLAGYPPPRPTAGRAAAPIGARALVLGSGEASVALLSAEVLEIPSDVAAKIAARGKALGIGATVLTATHTHSSFGSYDPHRLAQLIGTGSHDAGLEAHLAEKLAEALEAAARARRPALAKIGRVQLTDASKNRAITDGPIDPELTVLTLDDEAGARIGGLVIFGAHPTLAGRHPEALDGDFPNRAMRTLEQGRGGVTLFLQGAVGDVTAHPAGSALPAVEQMGEQIAAAALEAEKQSRPAGPALSFASVEISLPLAQADAAVPHYLRNPAANFLTLVAPRTAEVEALSLDGLLLLFTPAEPTVAAAAAIRERLAPGAPAGTLLSVVGLAQGYVGYLETEARVKEGTGEARRTYFGGALPARVGDGLSRAVEAISAKPSR